MKEEDAMTKSMGLLNHATYMTSIKFSHHPRIVCDFNSSCAN